MTPPEDGLGPPPPGSPSPGAPAEPAPASASAHAPILRLQGLTRRFGEVVAVDQVGLDVAAGEFLTLLGPSGCGKTTTLRLVAGFEQADEGRIVFRDADVTAVPPQRRGFGMVFQNYALFPHLSVQENVAFGLRTRRMKRSAVRTKVDEALARVELAGYGERRVQDLSGGQQQRVALARALAIEPPLLLLDEPLSNLDAGLREKTRRELRRLVKELGITAIFVTHDQEEAFDLSDRIAVMNAGRLHQVGTPAQLYREPADLFVAGFVGRTNRLWAVITAPPGRKRAAQLRAGPYWSVLVPDDSRLPAGGDGIVVVRPEELVFTEREEDPRALTGVVRERRFHGPVTTYFVEVEGLVDQGGLLEVAAGAGGPAVGDQVRVTPRQDAHLSIFPPGEDS